MLSSLKNNNLNKEYISLIIKNTKIICSLDSQLHIIDNINKLLKYVEIFKLNIISKSATKHYQVLNPVLWLQVFIKDKTTSQKLETFIRSKVVSLDILEVDCAVSHNWTIKFSKKL